ncbi:MAG TPA: hypothetical protein VF070_33315 [Streptosporangiaceae bacterium]
MNEFSNETSGRYAHAGIRHARHIRHLRHLHRLHRRLHRLSHGFGDGQDASCRERRGRPFGHHRGLEDAGRPVGFARRGHHDHSGRGRNRRAVYELHMALADIARAGDEQLRGEAAQIVTEATSRLNHLLDADR